MKFERSRVPFLPLARVVVVVVVLESAEAPSLRATSTDSGGVAQPHAALIAGREKTFGAIKESAPRPSGYRRPDADHVPRAGAAMLRAGRVHVRAEWAPAPRGVA